MISVADGDPLVTLGPSNSVSGSKSGLVTIIRLVVTTTFAAARESLEVKVERTTEGWLVSVNAVVSVLTIGRSRCGLERVENEEGDIGGETKTVFLRATRKWAGGEGCGVGIGVKYVSRSRSCPW